MVKLAALVLLIAVLASVYILLILRRRPPQARGGVLARRPQLSSGWTKQAGEDLGELNEPARCDLIFAASQLENERSHRLLRSALSDPSAAVSLAAAHALARSGHIDDVENYAASAEEQRSKELLELLSLIG